MNLQEIIEEAQALRGLTRCGNWYESAESLIEAIAALCHPSSKGEAVELLQETVSVVRNTLQVFHYDVGVNIADQMRLLEIAKNKAECFLATRPTAPEHKPCHKCPHMYCRLGITPLHYCNGTGTEAKEQP